jgi:arylsulfatase
MVIKLTGYFLAALAVAILQAESLEGRRPNIILVMTDDQGMGDLSCMGNEVLRTPHLDRFYEQSTRFTEFHVSPTCAPTRSAIMCGRHEFRNGVTHTIHERENMNSASTTMPQVLQSAGYATGIFGKWHLGDGDEFQPYNRGFSEVFIHGGGAIGKAFPGSCSDFPPNFENRYFDNAILHNDTVVMTQGFCTDVFFQAALGWMKQQYDSATPFFAYIVPNAPHDPFIAPEQYKKRFTDLGWDDQTAGRYGMIENLDDNFGLLMQKLEAWDALQSTLVIFMTDNGQSGKSIILNGKKMPPYRAGFKSGKGSVFEGGTHVPAFWRWQGVLGEGVDINGLSAHIDLFKTFTELAGADIPEGTQTIDGRTLLPLLDNPQADWPDRELFIHRGRWGKGVDPHLAKHKGYAVRTQRWRMVGRKLYDIANDPYETKDVASQYPEVVERLHKSYDAWWNETVPLMVNEDRTVDIEHPYAVRYQQQKAERGIPDWVPPAF